MHAWKRSRAINKNNWLNRAGGGGGAGARICSRRKPNYMVRDEAKGCGLVGLLARQGHGPRPCPPCPTTHLSFGSRPRDGGFCPQRGAETAPAEAPEVPSQLWGPQPLSPSPGDTPGLPRHCGAMGMDWDPKHPRRRLLHPCPLSPKPGRHHHWGLLQNLVV